MDNSDYIKRAKKTIKERLSIGDLITKLVNLIDETEKSENTLFEAVYDFYFMYYPEAAALLKERDSFIKLLTVNQDRKEVAAALNIPENSMGYDLSIDDKSILNLQINELKNLSDLRSFTKSYLEKIIMDNYPNLYNIGGDMVSARLIMLSGGIKRLAFMPASKLQVLGAEKAMFLHQRKGKSSPKYGVIFKNPTIEGAPQDKRGKLARALASKLSLAAKMDLFTKKGVSENLKIEFDKEVKRILNDGTKKDRR
jgi:nucleolar protein 56